MILVRVLFCILSMMIICESQSCAFLTTAEVTIRVVDDEGIPVEDARVGIGFNYNSDGRTLDRNIIGTTNDEGVFGGSASCNGNIGFNVFKEGFYKTFGNYDYQRLGALGWIPHNPEVKVVLRKIGDPIPMYARDTKKVPIEIPVVDKDVGFDLIQFDWVAPYGIGVKSDFIFNLKKQVVDNQNFDVAIAIKFSNESDGIQLYNEDLQYGSVFKLPRFAPKNGYINKLFLHEWRTLSDGSVQRNFDFVKRDLNYIFRVRSEVNEGIVEHAMYGKIHGIIDFYALHSPTAKIYFEYYLNPDGTRNLEYDVSRNLFRQLPRRERVGIK